MASPEAICGNCRYFDRNDVAGKPVGTIVINGVETDTGFCRAEKGLVLGTRIQTGECKMPEGTFEPAQSSLIQDKPIPQESPAL